MRNGLRILTAASALVWAGALLLPATADARSSSRRNYAEEWEQEEREERYREERERARQEYLESQKERQERYIQHQERQLDTVIDHHERTGHYGLHPPVPGAPAPPSKGSGTCIYGEGNKILYQPKGVVCTHGQ